jgi:hypothetical protein
VFWLICDKEVIRCTKYENEKIVPFREWCRQTLPAQ